jgi:hypothetical protein
MKRTVVALALVVGLALPATSAFAASGNGNGPRYTCTSPFGSVHTGATPGTAKQLERAGYVCVRSN